jgi:thiopeptide-type bacteriocin biosynthesis protein
MNKDSTIFTPGSEWLYYKVYCGTKTSDIFLLEILKPLTKILLNEKLIDQWFFIRYSDPEPHLRIRFHIKNLTKIGYLIIKIKDSLSNFIISNQIWDIQIATYTREMQRYGKSTINQAEQFFFFDSIQALSIIEQYTEEEEKFIAVFKWCEFIVDLFSLNDLQQLSFLDKAAIQYKLEFRMGKGSNKQLSNKYRKIEEKLFNNFNLNIVSLNKIKIIINDFIYLKNKNKLEVDLENLLSSLIHMTFNRCFNINQRHYEMIFYDFMFRKNKSNYIRYGKL